MDKRLLNPMPKEAAQEFTTIAKTCITEIILPCLAKESEICLLPKNEHDERPIGFMSTCYRVFSRLFQVDLRAFDEECGAFWDTAMAGSSALQVALHRLILDEASSHDGHSIASVSWDFKKF